MSLPKPNTRTQQYLNKIAGGEGIIPAAPKTAEEAYLAAIAENGGGELPESTAADADKVLTVGEDGSPEWAEAQGGGESPVMMVTFTIDSETSDITADKTLAEIQTAYNGGTKVIGTIDAGSIIYGDFYKSNICRFEMPDYEENTVEYLIISGGGAEADEWTVTNKTYTLTPATNPAT